MVAVTNVVTTLDIVRGALLVVHRLEGGGVADPTLLVMDGAAVLLVASLVHVLTLVTQINNGKGSMQSAVHPINNTKIAQSIKLSSGFASC